MPNALPNASSHVAEGSANASKKYRMAPSTEWPTSRYAATKPKS